MAIRVLWDTEVKEVECHGCGKTIIAPYYLWKQGIRLFRCAACALRHINCNCDSAAERALSRDCPVHGPVAGKETT